MRLYLKSEFLKFEEINTFKEFKDRIYKFLNKYDDDYLVDVALYENENEVEISIWRQETPEEEKIRVEKYEAERKEYRRKQYEELKKEFESGTIG